MYEIPNPSKAGYFTLLTFSVFFTFIQCINDQNQWRGMCRGSLIDLRQRLQYELLELFFQCLRCDFGLIVDCASHEGYNIGDRMHELCSDGGEKFRRILTIGLTSFEEKASSKLVVIGKRLRDRPRDC